MHTLGCHFFVRARIPAASKAYPIMIPASRLLRHAARTRHVAVATRAVVVTPTANYHDSVTDLIGSTPMVKLNRVPGDVGATILAKLEFQNPGGSVKDRIAKNTHTHTPLCRADRVVSPTRITKGRPTTL